MGGMPDEGIGRHEVARRKYGRNFENVVGGRRRFGLSDRAGVHVLYRGDLSANEFFLETERMHRQRYKIEGAIMFDQRRSVVSDYVSRA